MAVEESVSQQDFRVNPEPLITRRTCPVKTIIPRDGLQDSLQLHGTVADLWTYLQRLHLINTYWNSYYKNNSLDGTEKGHC